MNKYYFKGTFAYEPVKEVVNDDVLIIYANPGSFIQYVKVAFEYQGETKYITLQWDQSSSTYSVTGDFSPQIQSGIVDTDANHIRIILAEKPSGFSWPQRRIISATWISYSGYITDF